MSFPTKEEFKELVTFAKEGLCNIKWENICGDNDLSDLIADLEDNLVDWSIVSEKQKITYKLLEDSYQIPENVKEKILDWLQDKGLIELIKTDLKEKNLKVDVSALEEELNRLSSILKFLYFLEEKKDFLFKEKNRLGLKDWQRVVNNYDYKKTI
ncbi:MAG: hypothetical protein QW303_09210, partial [Nitrososphaerota archaeon]